MKFGIQFEFHKIPEWYTDYLDYMKFKTIIKAFKKKLKSKYYFILRLHGYFKSNLWVPNAQYSDLNVCNR